MSDIDGSFDLREQIARIDRNQAETQKLFAEVRKLNAEAHKFNREWILQSVLAVTGLVGGVITVARVIWPGHTG